MSAQFESGPRNGNEISGCGSDSCTLTGVPGRQGRAKIIPDGGAAGTGSLAVPSDQQIPCCRITGGCRRPVLAPRAGGL